ncbi:beta strand repeat-containing protein, partial [Aquabacterium sp.]|uniref:beta strand repeat-containing protein n=1 Tax=Aquabacterium sp. TaxID=1872578 RepID=UPI002CE8FD53
VKSQDGTSKLVTITIGGRNDAALISGTSVGAVVEAGGVANAVTGTLTAGGDLFADDVDDAHDAFAPVPAGAATLNGYGSFGIDAAGVWTYTLDNSHAAVQALNVGQSLGDSFVVASVDGTAHVVSLSITGRNDAAVISGQSEGAVIEAGGLANGSAGLPTAGGNLYAIDVDNPNDSFQAVAAGATSVNGHGSYCVDAAGKWSFTLDDARAAVQALNVGDALVDRFAVLSIDGTSQTVTITIDGQNDAAAISGDTSGAVVEAGGVANGMAGTATASGDLSADDIDNPDDAFEAVAAGAATVNGYGSFGVDAAGVWTFSLDDSHAAVQALNVGQSLSDSFTVHSADGTAQLVTVSIAGRNDAALITGQSTVAVLEAGGLANASASAGAGTVSANGNLYADDIDNPDDAFQAVSAGAATGQGYGSYGLSAGGQWSYALNNAHASVQALNVGDTLTDWFTVLSVDGTAQVVTITIDGRNDAAAISGDTSGAVIEAGGLANGSAGSPQANGDLLAEDVDNIDDAFHPVAAGTTTSSGYGRYGVDADGQWRYTLDDSHPSVQALTVGQSLNDTFTVSSVDGTAQVVTVSIAGRNDTALISGDTTGTAVEAGGAANATAGTAASGELYADDLDHPDDVFQAVAPDAASGQGYGSYGVDAGGKWTYTLNDAHAAVQALNVGSTLSDSFTVLSADGTAQEVTVTIEGRNDAAAISGGAAAAVVEAGGAANGTAGTPGATGELFADDVDNDDDSFQPVPAGTLTASGYGRYGVSAGGQWTYLLDDDSPAVQALNTTDTLTDTFTVTTVDGTTKEVTISIAGRNDTALITGKLNGTVAEAGGIDNGSPGSPSATGALLADDVDNPDNAFQALAAGTASAAGYGSYTIDAAGQWTYTLDDLNAAVQALHVGQSLADSFAVLSEDGTVTTVALTIQGANDAPTAGGDAASGNEDTPITTGNVLANDADVDGVLGAGSITAHGQGAHGSVVYNGNGSFTYTPAANYAGSDSFSYTITDEHGATASAVVLMTVNDVIDAPVNTVPAALTVAEDGSKTLTGLAIADADAGSSTLSTTLSVAHGTLSFGSLAGVTLSGNGSASVTLSGTLAALNAALATAPTYVPAANYNGDDTLSMSTSDGALSDSDAVAITVMAVNDAPVAASDVIIMSDGTSGVISVAALLANDSDSDGKALAITAVSTSNLPSVTLNANGSIGITVSNADGSFSYTLDDGAGGITTGTVTVTLKPVTGSGNIVDLSGLSYQASYIDAKNGGDTLTGVAPGDVLIGGDGSDTLKGGNGADTLRGGRDNDTLDGEGGIDLLDLSDATGAITLTLNQGTAAGGAYHSTGALPSSLGTDQYRNMEGVIGGLGNDTLTGSTADDTLIGNGGTDTLHGVNGNDILRGGAANDTLDGGAGIDLLDFSDAGAAVSLILSQGSNGGGNWSTGAQSGLGTDAYKNMEGVKGSVFNDALTGSSGDDVLLGDAGHDLLSGGSGSDVLVGGAGADILTGGAGSDRFAFVGDAASVDQIVDFQTGLGNDVLDVSALLIGYSAGSLAAWIQLRESGNDSIVSVDRDGAGSAYAPQDIAVLQGVVVDLVQLVGSANLDATLDNLWPGA